MHLQASTLSLVLGIWPRLLVSVAALALVWSAARAANRRLSGALPWDLDVLGASVLAATCLTLPALLLGALGALRDWTWLVGALLAAAVLRLWAGRAPAAPARPGVAEAPPTWIFTVVTVGFLVGRMLYGLRNPPADWDSYHYHLPMVAYWMQSGSLGVPLRDPPVFGAYFPGNGELLQMWAAWSVGRDTLMTWTGILSLSVLALALRRLAILAGARTAAAEGCALCFTASPGITQLTLGAKVDHVAAAWFAAALVFALRARRREGRGDMGLMLCALGLLAGTKSTGPPHALLVLAVAWVGLDASRALRALVANSAAAVAALAMGGFWLARNGLATGNPLYPAEIRLGAWTLPGLMSSETLRRTTQWTVWREGWTGHLTVAALWRFMGPVLAVMAAGLLLWVGRTRAAAPPQSGHPAPRSQAGWLAALTLTCAAVYLFTPFSGAYEPASGGHPPPLNWDNLRLVFFTAVCALPLAAAGLSGLGSSWLEALVLGGVFLWGLAGKLGHVVPGIVLAAVLVAAGNWFSARAGRFLAPVAAALALVGTLALASAVAWVGPMRERITAGIWDHYAGEIHNLSSATVRSLRARAAGRPVACAGIDSWWAYYGSDFSGHPVYVPAGVEWEEGRRPYRLVGESRAQADRALWLANLARSGAVCVVVGSPGRYCQRRFEESRWCASDSARFRLLAARLCDSAYQVQPLAGEIAGRSRTAPGADTSQGRRIERR